MRQGQSRLRLPAVLVAIGVLGAVLVFSALGIYRYFAAAGSPGGTSGVRVTISKETTYITSPLRPDGYPDYVAALNQIASKGVTPENNAVVLLMQAFGPAEIEAPVREWYFKTLGMPVPPELGEYLGDTNDQWASLLEQYTIRDQSADEDDPWLLFHEHFQEIREHPWSKEELPGWAGWLQENERPLRLVVAASRRARYFAPQWLPDKQASDTPPTLAYTWPPAVDRLRKAARLLTARAMGRLGAGGVNGAWEDLLACHRLARLVGQQPFCLSASLSYSIDREACVGDVQLIEHGNLSAEQARRMLADLQALDPLPSMADKFDIGERYMLLDAVCAMARGEADLLSFIDACRPSGVRGLVSAVQRNIVDWDEVLKAGNTRYDRLVQALEQPDYSQSVRALERLDVELAATPDAHAEQVIDLKRTREIADALLSFFTGSVVDVRVVQDQAQTRFDLAKLGFALAAYRAEHGQWPEGLSALVPDYLAELPNDVFTGKPLHYRREGEGFLLYSVGPNMQDDGGRNASLDEEEAELVPGGSLWDDLRLQIPTRRETLPAAMRD